MNLDKRFITNKDHNEIKTLLEKMLKRGDEIRLSISYEINELLEKIEREHPPKVSTENIIEEPTKSNVAGRVKPEKPVNNTEENLSIGFQALALLLPLAGFIMFFIYKDTAESKANRAIILALVGMILVFLLVGSGYDDNY